MTDRQFDAVAALLRSRAGPIETAARRVLVDGLKQSDAARELAVRPDALNNALRRYRRTLDLARKAVAP